MGTHTPTRDCRRTLQVHVCDRAPAGCPQLPSCHSRALATVPTSHHHVPASREGQAHLSPCLPLLGLTRVPWNVHSTFETYRILEGPRHCGFLTAAGPRRASGCIRGDVSGLLRLQREKSTRYSWVDHSCVSSRMPQVRSQHGSLTALIGTIYENTEGSFVAWRQTGFEVGLNTIHISALPLAVCPWERYLTSLNRAFLSYRVVT